MDNNGQLILAIASLIGTFVLGALLGAGGIVLLLRKTGKDLLAAVEDGKLDAEEIKQFLVNVANIIKFYKRE